MWEVWDAKPAGKNLQLDLEVDERGPTQDCDGDSGFGRLRGREGDFDQEQAQQGSGKGILRMQQHGRGGRGETDGRGKWGSTGVGAPKGDPMAPIPQTEELVRPPRLTLDKRTSEGGPGKEKSRRPT
ncbi:hypothetical protein PV326_008737 [Microctonus aethiopoides]|nr:hypothetical protein PV326_008737 [Microctonus aethiopoides]